MLLFFILSALHIYLCSMYKLFTFSSETYTICSNSGNHERDTPNTGGFYDTNDSGGECGVPAETMFFVPADNRAKFW